MKYLVLFLLVLSPVLAHESNSTEAIEVDSLYASTNSFAGVNPFVQFSQGNIGQGVFATVLWTGMILGMWQLLKLVLIRFIEF